MQGGNLFRRQQPFDLFARHVTAKGNNRPIGFFTQRKCAGYPRQMRHLVARIMVEQENDVRFDGRRSLLVSWIIHTGKHLSPLIDFCDQFAARSIFFRRVMTWL